jgi:hypothetical protein
MKFIVSTFFILSSSIALSCPDLSGRFYCQGSSQQGTLLELNKTIDANEVVTYEFKENGNAGSWIVDGLERSLQRSSMDGVTNLKYRAFCSGEVLTVKMTGELQAYSTTIEMITSLNLDSSRNLVQNTSGNLADGTPLPNMEALCHRVLGPSR